MENFYKISMQHAKILQNFYANIDRSCQIFFPLFDYLLYSSKVILPMCYLSTNR